MTLKSAKETFDKAQEVALEAGDDHGELIAIGLSKLTDALTKELRKITSQLDDLERRVKRLD